MSKTPPAAPRPAAVLHGIANCDTVRAARGWLDAHGVAYRFHDFRKQGVPAADLDAWIAELGWEALLNRRGLTWKKLDPAARDAVVDAASAAALMRASASVIRRPVVRWADGALTVGFDETAWRARR